MKSFPSTYYLKWFLVSRPQSRYSLGNSAIEPLNQAEWRRFKGAITLKAEPGFLRLIPLIHAIASHYRVPYTHVIPASGTSSATLFLFQQFLSPGDHVVLECPTYEPLLRGLQWYGVRISRLLRRFENGFAIDLKDLEARMTPRTRMIVLTTPHNPSGVAIPKETLRAIGTLARRSGAVVLCDEVYSEFLDSKIWKPAATLGPEFISTNSFAKAFGLHGIKVGWALASRRIATVANSVWEGSGVQWAHPSIGLAEQAFRDIGWIQRRSRTRAATNWTILKQWLEAHRTMFEWVEPSGGVICFVRLKKRRNTLALANHWLARYGLFITPGEFFDTPGAFRIGFGNSTSQLRLALRKLDLALHTSRLT